MCVSDSYEVDIGRCDYAGGRIVKLKWNPAELSRVFTFRGFDAFDDFCKDDKKAISESSVTTSKSW